MTAQNFKRLQEVRDNFDWRSYLEANFTTKKGPRDEVRICCFVCGDIKYKLYVGLDRGVFNCFKCEFSSRRFDCFDFVSKAEGISRAAAQLRLFAEHTSTTPVDLQEALETEWDKEDPVTGLMPPRTITGLPKGCLRLEDTNLMSSRPYWRYLLSRGLTEKDIRDSSIHYSVTGQLACRVIWPVYGQSGSLISWVSRTIIKDYKKDDKYFNCPDSDINKTLWPYVKPTHKDIILVEGILDCLAVRRLGLTAYATFGKKISADQIHILRRWGVSAVTIFWDRRDAKRQIVEASETLKTKFVNVYVPSFQDWPPEKDAGDTLLDVDLRNTMMEMLEQRVDVNSMEFLSWQLTV